MNTFSRLSQFVSDLVGCGPLYAIANYRIHSPLPLDPTENWQFWTRPKPDWLASLMRNYPLASKRKSCLETLLTQDHASGIEAHYDVSNDFYALFLDTKYRFYTCAEFFSETETLEEAQTHKAEHILSLLKLDGSEKILDLGCGWGAMLNYLQEKGHEGELFGFTLSKEQLAYNQQRLKLNVSLTNFITEPFKQAPYDRIFSIGGNRTCQTVGAKSAIPKDTRCANWQWLSRTSVLFFRARSLSSVRNLDAAIFSRFSFSRAPRSCRSCRKRWL